jgi:hypothetical protein
MDWLSSDASDISNVLWLEPQPWESEAIPEKLQRADSRADAAAEISQIKQALSAMFSAMAAHRPSEGRDVAAALRAMPGCAPGSVLDALASELEAATGAARLAR